jgi:hypothetical protein
MCTHGHHVFPPTNSTSTRLTVVLIELILDNAILEPHIQLLLAIVESTMAVQAHSVVPAPLRAATHAHLRLPVATSWQPALQILTGLNLGTMIDMEPHL